MRDFLKEHLTICFLLIFACNIGVTILAGFTDILKRNKKNGAWQLKNACLEVRSALYDKELGFMGNLFLFLFFGQFGLIVVIAFTYHEWRQIRRAKRDAKIVSSHPLIYLSHYTNFLFLLKHRLL